jgi:ketosteroid isomerase-like protein
MTGRTKALRRLGIALAAGLALATGACTGDGRGADEAELRAVLQAEREAHLARDAARFVAGFTDSMTSVNRGTVSRLARDDYRARFQSYFDAVEFEAWDDRAPARIVISEDGSLAYAIVEKTVRTRDADTTATTEFAWVSIYRKVGGRWLLECNASTNR